MPAIIGIGKFKSRIKGFHVYRKRIEIGTELKCELELENQHNENAFIVKTIESDEIVGHGPEFLAQVLAPMMQSGEIASINVACTCEPRNVRGTWVLGGEIEMPFICQICGCKKKK